jgi:hypothetical protein
MLKLTLNAITKSLFYFFISIVSEERKCKLNAFIFSYWIEQWWLWQMYRFSSFRTHCNTNATNALFVYQISFILADRRKWQYVFCAYNVYCVSLLSNCAHYNNIHSFMHLCFNTTQMRVVTYCNSTSTHTHAHLVFSFFPSLSLSLSLSISHSFIFFLLYVSFFSFYVCPYV